LSADTIVHDPEAFHAQPLERQLALLAWIGFAIESGETKNRRSSDEIKQDFEQVGFPITNGVFKGAMQASGYKPKVKKGQLWYYAIRPRSRNAPILPGERWYGSTHVQREEAFLLSHLTLQQRKTFDALVELARMSH